jgi:NADPH:quinone reductase-like Zn-dependent oxidoreductase
MRAVVQKAYGSSSVLGVAEIEPPVPGARDVLVRVHAASLHAGDHLIMRGSPYIARFSAGWPRPHDYVVGLSAAGIVEAVGSAVTLLAPGDRVFGECRGSCAELALGTEEKLVRIPDSLTFEHAAAFPTSALAALHGLRDAAKVKPGMRVLIIGASGGVGTFEVQIAKAMGAHVTGVCSAANVELVRSLGADDVIDYTKDDFADGTRSYDVILDNVGNRTFADVRRALTDTGVAIPNSGTAGMGRVLGSFVLSVFVRRQGPMYLSEPNRADLLALVELIESGAVHAVIDRVVGLEEVPAALAQIEQGHTRGKVVVRVQQ